MKQNSFTIKDLEEFAASCEGEVRIDRVSRLMYATDASIYREEPAAVFYPAGTGDLKKLLSFAAAHRVGIIPRAAGTSLQAR